MAITVHVYQIYIAAGAEQVWQAITESDWTTRYFHSTSFVEPPAAGQPFRTVTADGRDAIDGVVEEMEPPVAGRPGRFVQTWHVLYDAAMAAEPPGRVEWTVEQVGDGLTRVRLVHGGLAFSPVTWASVKDGWVWVLDAMKTVIETGTPLPRVSADVSDESPRARESEPPDGTWHRTQGVEATNATWALVDKPDLSSEDEEDLLRSAYAAAYHWQRAAHATPANAARATYLIAKALLITRQPTASLRSADQCLAICSEHELDDFDLAYAHEARARALRALGREDEADLAWSQATAVTIADDEDREIVTSDFADY